MLGWMLSQAADRAPPVPSREGSPRAALTQVFSLLGVSDPLCPISEHFPRHFAAQLGLCVPGRGSGDSLSRAEQSEPRGCSGNISCLFQPPPPLGCSAPRASCRPRSAPGTRSRTAAARGSGQWQRHWAGVPLAQHRDLGQPLLGVFPALLGMSSSALAFSSSLGPCSISGARVPHSCAGGASAARGAESARSRGGRRCFSRRSLSCRWLERSLPGLGSGAAAVLQPQLELLWAGSSEVALYVSQQCSSLLSQLRSSLPWLAEWVRRVSCTLEGTRDISRATGHRGL